MLGQIDYIEPDHSAKRRPYDSIPFKPARGLKDLPEIRAALKRRSDERQATALRQSKTGKKSQGLTKNERTFLNHMSLSELEPINMLFERMGNPSPATQQKIIRKHVKEGLIETKQVRSSKSPLRLGQLTKAGWDYLNDKPKFKPLRGGIVHTRVCRWKQARDIKRGCDESICECPYPNSKGFSDVGTWINGKLHCTEVVIDCTSNICGHVTSCFIDSNEVETLTIVTLLKSEHEAILNKIMSDPKLLFYVSRISFLTVDQILKELYGR
jgi:DNA-binding PadR family transcriptional regulator